MPPDCVVIPGAPSWVPIEPGPVPGRPAPRAIAARVESEPVVGPCFDAAPLSSERAGASARTAADQDERGRNVEAGPTGRLHELIAGLSSADRKTLLLHVLDGLSIQDIVSALGVTPTAVRLARHKARTGARSSRPDSRAATRARVVLLPGTPRVEHHSRRGMINAP